MRRPWLLAAALAVAAVAVAVIALARDDSPTAAVPVGFPDNPEGRKPLIFDVGLLAGQTSKGALPEAHSVGADGIRVLVPWYSVAPAERPKDFKPADPLDPRYDF